GSAFGNHQLFEKSWAKTFSFGFYFIGAVCYYSTAWINQNTINQKRRLTAKKLGKTFWFRYFS
ncbi:MAG: hypothetical protein ACI4JM_02195, partial [Oscillospiraceae bacterium]